MLHVAQVAMTMERASRRLRPWLVAAAFFMESLGDGDLRSRPV